MGRAGIALSNASKSMAPKRWLSWWQKISQNLHLHQLLYEYGTMKKTIRCCLRYPILLMVFEQNFLWRQCGCSKTDERIRRAVAAHEDLKHTSALRISFRSSFDGIAPLWDTLNHTESVPCFTHFSEAMQLTFMDPEEHKSTKTCLRTPEINGNQWQGFEKKND